ncbi:O-antigen polymerase family protein [Minicystis rosea]|nr:O-antigen polymerase family protein [Minicystis rosea]
MAAWIACALAALVIVKPQEFISALAGWPLLYIAFAAAMIAIAADVVRRRIRLAMAPQVPFILGFFAWALVVTAVKRPAVLGEQITFFAVLGGIYAVIAMGCASPSGVRAFAVTFVACALLATTVAIVQSQRDYGCFLAAPEDWEGRGELSFDGRPCESVLDCRKNAPVPDGNYRCERRGPLSTATIGGRVRYRGSLADPNELSLTISIALPFVVALAVRRRRAVPARKAQVLLPPLLDDALLGRVVGFLRGLPALGAHVAVAVAVVLSKSRTGLLVFLAVVGIQAIRKLGAWGIVAGCVVGPPMLLLGGRSGAEADDSTDERAEILREAFELIRATKGIGLGAGQFTDASSIGMTAHNAYILAIAETGLIGYLLFCFGLYLSLKVPAVLWLGERRPPDADVARFAPAITAAIAGALLGITFLSWTYKDVLYMVLASSTALFSAARARDPRFSVKLSLREAALVTFAAMAFLVVVYVGSRLHR